jgi:hypothetical protein
MRQSSDRYSVKPLQINHALLKAGGKKRRFWPDEQKDRG